MTIESQDGTRRRRSSPSALVLAAALVGAAVALALVASRGPAPARTLEERVRAVAATLRCPVCQDLTVADSPSSLARQFRDTIQREIQAGRSPDQIRAGFVDAYGQWILMSPPKSGLGLVAWLAPAVLLLAGLGVAGASVRRWTLTGRLAPEEEAPALSEHERDLLDQAVRGFDGRDA